MTAHAKRYVKEGIHSQNGETIQVLPPEQTVPINITTTGTSQSAALQNDTQIVRIASAEDCRILFGNSGVSASATTSILFLAGTEVIAVPTDSNGALFDYIAVINLGTAGAFNVHKMGA